MPTVRMGDIWDRTTRIVQGRAAMILPIALFAIYLPLVIQAAMKAYSSAGGSMMLTLVTALVGITAAIAALWAHLAIMAIASDPATTSRQATAAASARLAPTIGLAIVEGFAFFIAFLPALIALAASGIDLKALATAGNHAQLVPTHPGPAIFAGFYSLVFTVVLLVIAIRLMLAQPTILHEPIGLRAIARSWRLTRGIGWRLFGVTLLALIVLFVVSSATTFVIGTLAALIVGGGATATLIARLFALVITTIFSVLFAIFIVQLYLARRDPIAAT